jgi:hypothetical protein
VNIQQEGKPFHTKEIHEVLAESQAGKLTYPEVMRRPFETGVNPTSAISPSEPKRCDRGKMSCEWGFSAFCGLVRTACMCFARDASKAGQGRRKKQEGSFV